MRTLVPALLLLAALLPPAAAGHETCSESTGPDTTLFLDDCLGVWLYFGPEIRCLPGNGVHLSDPVAVRAAAASGFGCSTGLLVGPP